MTTYTSARAGAICAVMAGTAILAASAYATIIHGKHDQAQALLTIALAIGILAGAAINGRAWSEGRRSLAIGIATALAAGELFNFVMTGDRLVTLREAIQAQVREAENRYQYALGEATKARSRHDDALSDVQVRLAARSTTAAEGMAAAKAPDCRDRCKAAIDQANAAAAAAVIAAQGAETIARQTLETARATLTANPKPAASGTPLADRTGLPAWAIDLVTAALLAFGANGLAAALIAYGAHQPHTEPDLAERLRRFEQSGARLEIIAPETDPTPPSGGRRTRRESDARRAKVASFVTSYRAKHGRDPSPAAVRAATGLPRSTAWRYQQDSAA